MDEDTEKELKLHTNANLFPSDTEWPWSLSEEDVPGAALGDKDLNSCNIPQLKFWLKCRGMPSAGLKKNELVELVSKCMSNKELMSDPILDPKYPEYTDRKIQNLRHNGHISEQTLQLFPSLRPPLFPPVSALWLPIKDITPNIQSYLKCYNHKTIFQYYSVMADSRDTAFHNRAVTRGAQHHAAGHVKSVVVNLQDPIQDDIIKEKGLYIKAEVRASMKAVTYNTKVSLYQYEPHTSKVKVRYAHCTCVAGQAGVCGHIAATLYQLIDARLVTLTTKKTQADETLNPIPCTSLPNSWKSKSSKRKHMIDRVPVEEYDFKKLDTSGAQKPRNSLRDVTTFNPCANQNINIELRLKTFINKFESDNHNRILPLWKLKFGDSCGN